MMELRVLAVERGPRIPVTLVGKGRENAVPINN